MAKKLTQEDLVLNIIVNGNKAQSEIGKVSREIQDYKSKLTAAEAEMKQLEKTNATSSARYQSLGADVRRYNASIADAKARLDALNVSLKLEDKTEKELEVTLRRLVQLRKQSVPNSEQYKEYSNQITLVRSRLEEVKASSENTGNSLLNTSNKLNKYIGAIVAGGASMVAIWTGVKRATEDYAHFDDVLADVMKTTNLEIDAVKELNNELAKIETRTSQEDLLGLSRIAGKLGYTEVAELTEFVRANNQIIVALNEDLGGNVEETVNKIGKLVDIFKLKDMYTTEEAFLKVGSAINELGMASTANEGYMVEFARRMAGIAPLAGVTIEEILGLGATLDQLGQTEEVSSTALSKLFLQMAKDAKTYAKYAGMDLESFRKYLETDFMGAFTKVLQGVKGNSAGINELAATLGDLGQDGGRVIGVIGSLANNVDVLTGSISLSNKAMQEGTSVTDEYNIKNQTAAAKLDMAKKNVKALWIELGEKLWPIITQGLGLWAMTIKSLSTLTTFIYQNIKVITTLVIAVTAYYTAIQVAAKWEAITTAAMGAKRIVVIALSGTWALLTGNIERATIAQRILNVTMLANPYALLIAGATALIAVFINYEDKIRGIEKAQGHLSKAMKKATDDTAGQIDKVGSLNRVMTNTNVSMEKRLIAMDQIKQLMPGVLDGYSKEALLAGKAKNAINQYTDALLLNAEIKAMQFELDEIARKRREVERGDVGLLTSVYREFRKVVAGGARAVSMDVLDNVESLMNLDKASKELINSIIDRRQKLSKMNSPGLDPVVDNPTKVTIVDKKAEKAAEQARKKAEKERKEAFKNEKKEAEKEYQDKLQAEGLFRKDLKELTADELDKLVKIQEDYQRKVDTINTKYGENLTNTTKVAESEVTKRLAAEQRFIDGLLIKRKSEADGEKEAYMDRLQKAGLAGVERESMTARQLSALEVLQKEHLENLSKIDSKNLAQEIDSRLAINRDELTDLKIKHNEELSEITSLAQAKDKLSTTIEEKDLKRITTLNQARKLIQNQQQLEQEALLREHLEEMVDLLKKAQETGSFDGLELADSIFSEAEQKVITERLRSVLEELAKIKGYDKSIDLDAGRGKVDVLGMSVSDWEGLFSNIDSGKFKITDMLGVMGAATQFWGEYNKILANKENEQLQRDNDMNERKKENLKKRLEHGTISQELYNKEVEKLDKEMDKKKSEVQHKQAKREKTLAIVSAIINTAKAVTAVLPNFILAGIVGAFGALQVGTIASTPLPSIQGRESGGFLKVERSQDGKMFNAKLNPGKRGYVSEPTVIVGENGNEWVANADAISNPAVKSIIDVLDVAQRNGSISTLGIHDVIANSSGRRSIQGRQVGGYVNRGAEGNDNYVDPRLVGVLEDVNNTMKRLEIGIKNIKTTVALLGPDGFIEKMNELNEVQQNANI